MEKDKAREWTDNKLEDMEDEISKIYKKSAKGITKKWTKFMSESSDAVSKYQTAYDEAVSGGDKDLIDETSKALQTAIKNQTIGNSYYKGMVDEVTTQLSKVNQTALAYVNNQMPSVYTQNFNFMSTDTKKLVANSGIKFNLVDESVVKRRVKDGDITLPKKKVDVPKDKRWNTKQLNSSVLQGILQGESMKDISKRILPVVGNNQASAIRNARTMVTGAENQGRLDRYKDLEARGAIIKKVWMATGDARTRDWHLTLDGQERDLDEDFIDGNGNHLEMPGDAHAPAETVYNCRCTTKSHILGFRKADGSVAMIDYDYSQDEESLHSKEISAERGRRQSDNNTQNVNDLTSGLTVKRPNKNDYDDYDDYLTARKKYRQDKEKATTIVSNWFDNNIANEGITDNELKSWAEKNNVKLVGNFDGMDRQALKAYTERFDQLSKDFPLVQEWQGYFGIPFEVGFDSSMMYDAEASHGMMFGAPYSDYKDVVVTHFFASKNGDFVSGENSAVCTFDHEWGHNVYFAMTQYGYHSEDRDYDRIKAIKSDVLKLADLDGMSDYATTNDDELFAEAFAAWYGGEQTEFAKGMGKLLKKWGVIQ